MITLRAAPGPAPAVVPRGPELDTVIPGPAPPTTAPHRTAAEPRTTGPHRTDGPPAITRRHAAWLRLWMTVLGLAYLTGRPLPVPPPKVRDAAAEQPCRTDRLVGSLAERLAAERGAALRGSYPPAALARALTSAGRRALAGWPVPARAGQVWVIPQLRWAHEAARAGWAGDWAGREG
ncbi:MAG: hypothetical protein J2P26_15370, partial [Nocardiopsaceae bacterium]|nr:hypothetical protein [Nocardiopsaceae bacterium]